MSTQGNALAGALSATLQAIEIHKLISGEGEASIAGSEALFDARHQKHYLTRLDRNPNCRFSHERFSLRKASSGTLEEAFALTPGPSAQKRLFVPEFPFVSCLICDACDDEERVWRLRDSLDDLALACPRCAQPRAVRGFDLAERLLGAGLAPEEMGRSLADLGIRKNEVFGIEGADATSQYFILVDPQMGDLEAGGVSLVVGGLGNIGSFLAPHLARMEEVTHVVLCDPDAYEPGQQIGQDIPTEAVGRNKALVQAERLRAIRPELHVESFATPVEHLPLGKLHGAVVVSCLDTRAARLHLAARAWRVGSPFVDAAVGGGGSLLVRTNVYLPEPGAACFECAFEASDYEELEQVFPCDAQQVRSAHNAVAGNKIEDKNENLESRLSAGSATA